MLCKGQSLHEEGQISDPGGPVMVCEITIRSWPKNGYHLSNQQNQALDKATDLSVRKLQPNSFQLYKMGPANQEGPAPPDRVC